MPLPFWRLGVDRLLWLVADLLLLAELRFAPVPDREPLLEREAPLRERAEAAGFERDEVAAFERDDAFDLFVGLARPLAAFVEPSLLFPLREVDLLLLAILNPFHRK